MFQFIFTLTLWVLSSYFSWLRIKQLFIGLPELELIQFFLVESLGKGFGFLIGAANSPCVFFLGDGVFVEPGNPQDFHGPLHMDGGFEAGHGGADAPDVQIVDVDPHFPIPPEPTLESVQETMRTRLLIHRLGRRGG